MSFLQVMRRAWRPDHPAIVELRPGGSRITYAQLDDRILRAAGWLTAQGLRAGDVVGLQMPRSLAFLELHLAALGLGIATLPLNPAYTLSELRFFLGDSHAKLAVLLPDNAAALAGDVAAAVVSSDAIRAFLHAAAPSGALPDQLPADTTAVIAYTSGTTGRPKGAVIAHSNMAGTVEALHQGWRWSNADRILHALPMFHIHGLFVAQLGALHAGATALWMPRFDADAALQAIAEHRATVFMGVPTFYNRFLRVVDPARFDTSSMRLFTSGSAPLPAAVHEEFQSRFGHRVLERYGMTEVGIVLSNPYDGERRAGAVGFPLPGVSAKITDRDTGETLAAGEIGEIRVQGPGVISGYLGLPQQTAEALGDGWMKTGDLGLCDADGYFHIVGRAGDMVISGGLNVYPREVEKALLQHPDVAEVAVVGVPDPDLGERVVAAVVAKPGAQPDPDALISHARTELAPYKCPKQLRLIDALPRNSMGKVQKRVLRDTWDV